MLKRLNIFKWLDGCSRRFRRMARFLFLCLRSGGSARNMRSCHTI